MGHQIPFTLPTSKKPPAAPAHLPNVHRLPSAASSAVWSSPQLTCCPRTPSRERTTAGVLRFSMSPCPSWPWRPCPQVNNLPSTSRAAEWLPPHATWITPSGQSRLMGRGTSEPAACERGKGQAGIGSRRGQMHGTLSCYTGIAV